MDTESQDYIEFEKNPMEYQSKIEMKICEELNKRGKPNSQISQEVFPLIIKDNG